MPETGTKSNSQQVCCLCEGNEFEIVATRDRNANALVTVMCGHCGLISHRNIPTEEELTEFYSSEYRWAYHGERVPGPRRVMRAWKNGRRITKQLLPHLKPNSRLLEVGAGLGCTVRNLREAGFDASGIDPGEDFTKFAQAELGVNVACKSLRDVPDDKSYDAILMVHVIEHLRAPDDGLMRIHRLLKDDGLLYLECPNLDAPVARQNRLFHFAHIFNFTPSTLRMMAERCGFEFVCQFGRKRHPNLQMLFRKAKARSFVIRPHSHQRTLRRIRLNPVRYHLRPAYLFDRVRKLANYALEHMVAESFTERLIATSRPGFEAESRELLPFPPATEPQHVAPSHRAA